MPNLILTTACDNDCSYCFTTKAKNVWSIDEIEKIIPFLQSSKHGTLCILGGEPTQHPDFITILKMLTPYFPSIRIFTNGQIQTSILYELQSLQDAEISFCVNRTINHWTASLDNFYRKLGHLIYIGITFYRLGQFPDYIFKEIVKYHLQPKYRLGLAQSVMPPGSNEYIHPDQYSPMSKEIFSFIEMGITHGLEPDFDCGFPACFFNEDQQISLNRNHIHFKSICDAIPDIFPGMLGIPCLPLYYLNESFTSETNWIGLTNLLKEKILKCEKVPLFEQCHLCDLHTSGECSGGCNAMRIKKKIYQQDAMLQ